MIIIYTKSKFTEKENLIQLFKEVITKIILTQNLQKFIEIYRKIKKLYDDKFFNFKNVI